MTGTGMFSVDEARIVVSVGCTWCGVGVGQNCARKDLPTGRAHAQRWRDYWNATHPRSEQVRVYPATWRRGSR